jgi:hypothetical protein
VIFLEIIDNEKIHEKIGIIRLSLSRAKVLSGRWPLRFGVYAVVKRWRCCGERKGCPECKNGRTTSHRLQIVGCAAASTSLPPPNRSWLPSGWATPSLRPAGCEQDVGATSSYRSWLSELTFSFAIWLHCGRSSASAGFIAHVGEAERKGRVVAAAASWPALVWTISWRVAWVGLGQLEKGWARWVENEMGWMGHIWQTISSFILFPFPFPFSLIVIQ